MWLAKRARHGAERQRGRARQRQAGLRRSGALGNRHAARIVRQRTRSEVLLAIGLRELRPHAEVDPQTPIPVLRARAVAEIEAVRVEGLVVRLRGVRVRAGVVEAGAAGEAAAAAGARVGASRQVHG